MDSNELTNIIPIPSLWENLEKLEKRLFEVTVSEDNYLTEISQYLIEAGGKRFRPIISLLAGELGTGNQERVIDAGISVELIHLGSLYHDDVIDEATTRRGVESTNRKWNATLAILAGDYLLARSSELAADNLGLESVKLLASTYAELVVGQTREVQFSYSTTHSKDDYLEVIGGKTASLIRTSTYLQHPVFNTHHSETQMMRYIKQLENKDLSLNTSMISLGSCTMKLNAAAEMLPLSNPMWNNIHPFVPLNQAEGYQEVLKKLEQQLTKSKLEKVRWLILGPKTRKKQLVSSKKPRKNLKALPMKMKWR